MIPQLQQSEEWLEWRKTKIGASDAAIILGVSPWKTAYQLWEEKMGLKSSPEKSERMQRGIELEPKARACFEQLSGIKMQPEVLIHSEYEWMIASLDGISEDRTTFVEIKCTGQKDHMLAREGKIPDHYYPQIQHQLAVTGLPKGYYFSFDGEDGVFVEFVRNEDYLCDLIEKEKEFYKHMMDFFPPPLPYIEIDDPEFNSYAGKYLHVDTQIEWLEKQKKDLRESLINFSKGSNIRGSGIRLSKEIRRGAVDYSKVPELLGIDLNKYRKNPIECWKILKE